MSEEIPVVIAAVAATIFPFLYSVVAPWWRSRVGRALFLSEVSLALLLDISLVAYWWNFTISEDASLAILWFIAVTAWMRLSALVIEQVLSRRKGKA